MKNATAKAQDCKVVSVVGDKLTTTCNDGQENCYTVAPDAKVTCDGQPSQAAELKAGAQIRVTPCNDDKNLARAIESGKNVCSSDNK